jgi:hypothetical protein
MRKKCFREEDVFGFIREHADEEGLWNGDSATVAEEFGVPEDEAYAVLSEMCDRDRIQRIGEKTYIVTKWRERDEATEGELEP